MIRICVDKLSILLFSVSRPKLIFLLWHASVRLMWRSCLVIPKVWSLWIETKLGNIPKFYVVLWVVLFGCQHCFSCNLSRKNVALKVCVVIHPLTSTTVARNCFYVVGCWKWLFTHKTSSTFNAALLCEKMHKWWTLINCVSRKLPIYFCPWARYTNPCLVKTFTDIISIVSDLRAWLHGGGGPQIGEVTCGWPPHLSCKHDQIKIIDYMDRRVTSPTWGHPPSCKQALSIRANPKGFRTGDSWFYLEYFLT